MAISAEYKEKFAVKNSRVGPKSPNNQINKYIFSPFPNISIDLEYRMASNIRMKLLYLTMLYICLVWLKLTD